ncbi:hypothetical protein M3Y94_01307700 [Aphelenchoides besseyi]|nr:hypothetical protein M3Y94_01307700 [Aphelenchoides besseyi]KAI6220242.1 hypothetical protein M3Y95_01064300 [Aphelenchoides besseyi]
MSVPHRVFSEIAPKREKKSKSPQKDEEVVKKPIQIETIENPKLNDEQKRKRSHHQSVNTMRDIDDFSLSGTIYIPNEIPWKCDDKTPSTRLFTESIETDVSMRDTNKQNLTDAVDVNRSQQNFQIEDIENLELPNVAQLLKNFTFILKRMFQIYFQMTRVAMTYRSIAGLVLVFVGSYLSLWFLGLSAASVVELFFGWGFGAARLVLRSANRIFSSAADVFAYHSDLVQGIFCDLADRWCHSFKRLCSRRCEFVETVTMMRRRSQDF